MNVFVWFRNRFRLEPFSTAEPGIYVWYPQSTPDWAGFCIRQRPGMARYLPLQDPVGGSFWGLVTFFTGAGSAGHFFDRFFGISASGQDDKVSAKVADKDCDEDRLGKVQTGLPGRFGL